jgi:hypothetical protein
MKRFVAFMGGLVILLGSVAFHASVVFAEDATSTSFSAARMIINALWFGRWYSTYAGRSGT